MICYGDPMSCGPLPIASSMVRKGVLYPALPARCGLKVCATFASYSSLKRSTACCELSAISSPPDPAATWARAGSCPYSSNFSR